MGFFKNNFWSTLSLLIVGVIAFFTKELVTYYMLGFVLIMLSNIYDKLDDIYKIMKKSEII